MKVFKQTEVQKDHLLLVFAGWSVSPALFDKLNIEEEREVWICYDYRDLNFEEDISRFEDIKIIAWSFGVWVATRTIPSFSFPSFTTAVAINGTSLPIHDTFGIPVAIFKGTLENLTDEGIRRFNRRMCGKKELLHYYETIHPRPLAEIKKELENLYGFYTNSDRSETAADFWTHAILSTADRIFPVENLKNFWEGRCPVTYIEAPHFPFYKWKQWEEIWKE